MYELWDGDDQLPSCDDCLEGFHSACRDLMFSEKYGVIACGCENPVHEDS